MIKSLCLLSALTALVLFSLSEPVRYDNQIVIRTPKIPELLDSFRKKSLDIWSLAENHIDVRMTRAQLRDFNQQKKKYQGFKYTVLDDDLQETIERERRRLKSQLKNPLRTSAGTEFFKDYRSYDAIKEWMRKLAKQYPELVEYIPSIGKSVEGRDIMQMKITSSSHGYKTSKKRIWLQSLQHSREWIAAATNLYLANNLATKYGEDPRVTKILGQCEFVITPVANPDGYVYTWDGDRLWRKNRGAKNETTVYGVDLNRNWPEHWSDSEGASDNPRDDTYRGPSAASEPEVQALMKSFQSTKNILAAVDFHSYGELIMRPYSHAKKVSVDDAQFLELHQKMKEEATKSRGTKYTLISQLYPASGIAGDWFYDKGTRVGDRKKYGMSIELSSNFSDPNGWKFTLPPQEIVKVGEDMVPAVLKLAEWVVEKPLGEKRSQEE